MYVAKINDRGKAIYTYMFDDQLFDLDDIFNKSYYMTKSSDKEGMAEFCREWNHKHKDIIYKNKALYYANILFKGILQAPALVVLYSCIVMGAMLLFGSENFYGQIDLYGVAAFGNIRNTVIITYIIAAVLGLLASITTYNNVLYKFIRCVVSILTFILVSPVFFDKVFFLSSNKMLTLTIIAIVGCFFVRFILDRLILSIIRKNTEKLIRKEHRAIEEKLTEEVEPETAQEDTMSIIDKIRNGERVTQYRKKY